jgi:spore photoproduct lyase
MKQPFITKQASQFAEALHNRRDIVSREHHGQFWRPCPGTGNDYLCCGYQIITPLTGCGMYCSYCILQVYLEEQSQVVYTNFDDFKKEISGKLAEWKGVVRLGTGEFADSLFLEPKLGLSAKIAEFLEDYPNVLIEFKSKSAQVADLKKIRFKEKVVIGFSMNTPEMINALEHGTASLQRRLDAVRECEDMGFWIAYHFDPMVWYPEWEKGYTELARQCISALKDTSRIAWWSMGGFRTMPDLKRALRETNRHLPLFQGEMIIGGDGKYRYLRSIRTDFYKAVRTVVDELAPETTLYLCMESPEVWEEAGMMHRIPESLSVYLDRRAEEMLGIAK